MDANAPILFFDSGVGGLRVLGPTRALLPNAPIVYAADSAGFPYGAKSEAELAERVPALLEQLAERFQPRLIVIACNTASTIALDHVRAALDVPIVGTVPAIKPAAEPSKSRVIGVLGTEATVRQPYVDDLAARFAADCTIIRHGSPELVDAGRGKTGAANEVTVEQVRAAVQPMFDAPGGNGSTRSSSPAPISRLLDEEIARRLPRHCPGRRRGRDRAAHRRTYRRAAVAGLAAAGDRGLHRAPTGRCQRGRARPLRPRRNARSLPVIAESFAMALKSPLALRGAGARK